MSQKYSELNAGAVLKTVRTLGRRIEERFPEAGLGGVCKTLEGICEESKVQLAAIRRPIWPLRIASAVLLLVVAGLIVVTVVNVRVSDEAFQLTNFVFDALAIFTVTFVPAG